MFRRTVLIILIVLLPVCLFAQTASRSESLREGLLLFKQERFPDAIRVFQALVSDSRDEAGREAVADAYYWMSRAYLAISDYEEAARNLEYFLSNYPSNQYYPDALYQKGRLLYLQDDPESGIQVLESFVTEYPESEFAGSAYFWLGECLFSLGYLEEAARVFNKVIVEHPKSVKFEAASYRLSLIEYKKRENELLKLLKWSHEEALKSVEEFRRREKAYEQALAVYQRKLTSSDFAEADDRERSALQQLQSENEALQNRIDSLEARIASMAEGAADESVQAAQQRLESLESREKALRLKEEALSLKEALLLKLLEQAEQQ